MLQIGNKYMKKIKEYALYKGEILLAMGNISQIANKMGVKYRTIAFYKTPTYLKRRQTGKNYRELVEI